MSGAAALSIRMNQRFNLLKDVRIGLGRWQASTKVSMICLDCFRIQNKYKKYIDCFKFMNFYKTSIIFFNDFMHKIFIGTNELFIKNDKRIKNLNLTHL